MRIDPDTCHNSILLAAEVRRLNAVIAAGEMERLSQNSDCPAPDNAANSDKVFASQNMTNHGAAPAATAQLDTAERDSDHVAGTGDTLTDEEREDLLMWMTECLRQCSAATDGNDLDAAERWSGRAARAAALLERLGGER